MDLRRTLSASRLFLKYPIELSTATLSHTICNYKNHGFLDSPIVDSAGYALVLFFGTIITGYLPFLLIATVSLWSLADRVQMNRAVLLVGVSCIYMAVALLLEAREEAVVVVLGAVIGNLLFLLIDRVLASPSAS